MVYTSGGTSGLDCVSVNKNGLFEGVSCSVSLPAVCQKATGKDFCFHISLMKMCLLLMSLQPTVSQPQPPTTTTVRPAAEPTTLIPASPIPSTRPRPYARQTTGWPSWTRQKSSARSCNLYQSVRQWEWKAQISGVCKCSLCADGNDNKDFAWTAVHNPDNVNCDGSVSEDWGRKHLFLT